MTKRNARGYANRKRRQPRMPQGILTRQSAADVLSSISTAPRKRKPKPATEYPKVEGNLIWLNAQLALACVHPKLMRALKGK